MRGTIKTLIAALACTLLAGCMKSQKMAAGQMDELWRPTPSVWNTAEPRPVKLAPGKRYSRIEIYYEPSPLWAIIELHELAVQLPEGDTLRIPLSTQHAAAVTATMRQFAVRAQDLAGAAEDVERDPGRWAKATAEMIWQVHALSLGVSRNIEARRAANVDDTAAWVVMPILELLAGSHASELESPHGSADGFEMAESAISRVILTVSLRMTGRPFSQELLDQVLPPPGDVDRRPTVEKMRAAILDYYRRQPAKYEPLPRTARRASDVAERFVHAMDYLARLTSQWHNVNRLAFEFRRFEDRTVLGLEFDIRPGKQVVFPSFEYPVPALIFTGQGRVEVRLDQPDGGRIVRFAAQGGRGVQLHFSPITVLLVRMFGFPLEDMTLKEIRITPVPQCRGRITDVFLETVHDGRDRRRLLRVENGMGPVLAPVPTCRRS